MMLNLMVLTILTKTGKSSAQELKDVKSKGAAKASCC